MFTVEEMVRGYIVGISSQPLAKIRPESSLAEVGIDDDGRKVLAALLYADFQVKPAREEVAGWTTVGDVIAWAKLAHDLGQQESAIERGAGLDMVPEVML